MTAAVCQRPRGFRTLSRKVSRVKPKRQHIHGHSCCIYTRPSPRCHFCVNGNPSSPVCQPCRSAACEICMTDFSLLQCTFLCLHGALVRHPMSHHMQGWWSTKQWALFLRTLQGRSCLYMTDAYGVTGVFHASAYIAPLLA